mgnify:CR=1 FL=1
MIIQRTIQDQILERLRSSNTPNRVIIVYGARQVGKTTLIKEIIKRFDGRSEYFNCDYLDIQSVFSYENAGNLKSVIKDYELIVLDEAQRITNIGLVLKILHDEFPELKVLATGSSSFELSNRVNEPLTGRKVVYHLHPFTIKELMPSSSIIDIKRELNRILILGTYPSVILNDNGEGTSHLKEITSSYLFKDVLSYQNIKRPDVLTDLLKLLAFQISNEVSFTELSGILKVDQTVVQRYIQLLEDSFIVFRLPALKRNLRNEVGKTRKIYFWDIGVRNMLIQNLNTLDFRNDHGALWENFCISERMKHLKKDPLNMIQPYFWRTYSQKEVDYIEDNQGKINAYEFKWSEKKKVKIPRDFTNAYKNSAFEIITPDNFYNVLYG